MVHHSILIYTELLLHADVHLQQDPSRHFYFNETNHISTFHNLLWQAENAMLPHLQTLSPLCRENKRLRDWLHAHLQECEEILDIVHGAQGRHRYLAISCNGEKGKLSDLTRSEQHLLSQFLSIQQTSFIRYRNFLSDQEPIISNHYRSNCHYSDWLELGDALFQTGVILPTGTDTNEESFMRYFFEIFGHPLPPNYKRQLGQIRERNNPVRFLEKVRKDYLNKLSDLLKQKYCIIK